jgi:hypothetical protein
MRARANHCNRVRSRWKLESQPERRRDLETGNGARIRAMMSHVDGSIAMDGKAAETRRVSARNNAISLAWFRSRGRNPWRASARAGQRENQRMRKIGDPATARDSFTYLKALRHACFARRASLRLLPRPSIERSVTKTNPPHFRHVPGHASPLTSFPRPCSHAN